MSEALETLEALNRYEVEKRDCVFCKRIKNGEYERTGQAEIVWFEPLNPVTEGHILVVPKVHVADFRHHPRVTALTMHAASELVRGNGPANVITSAGAEATQTIRHLHIHVVPRRPGDGLKLPWSKND